jgi:LmbE family N-acetylglucosaminyl deacetylase
MMPLTPGVAARAPLTVLCLGAHADDIEIGCGGLLLRLLARRSDVTVHWIVLSAAGQRAAEARHSAQALLRRAGDSTIAIESFRDGFFPYDGTAVKEYFEALKGRVQPDVILTHQQADRHQDHRLVAELTWNTFRDHLILEYEVPKYDGGLLTPNLFVPLDAATCRRKVRHLMAAFPSQRAKHWYDGDTFLGLMRLRGVESGSPTGYAEGFHSHKAVLAW